jgi:hypothetical protein
MEGRVGLWKTLHHNETLCKIFRFVSILLIKYNIECLKRNVVGVNGGIIGTNVKAAMNRQSFKM